MTYVCIDRGTGNVSLPLFFTWNQTLTFNFTVIFAYASPIINSVSASSKSNSITGSNFGTNLSLVKVYYDNITSPAAISSLSDTSLVTNSTSGTRFPTYVKVVVDGQSGEGYATPQILGNFPQLSLLGNVSRLGLGKIYSFFKLFSEKQFKSCIEVYLSSLNFAAEPQSCTKTVVAQPHHENVQK